MLSRKFYDILSIVFILSLIGVFFFVNSFVDMGVNFDEPISKTNKLDMNVFMRGMALEQILISISMGIYGIFIIILAIQMYKRDFISMGDVMAIVLFSPLSIIWYVLILRKHYKKIVDNSSVI